MPLQKTYVERYARQILLEGIGAVGQKKFLQARVLIVGAGGLGSPCALYLAAAGIGTIGIVDADRVELNNLQRQILHTTKNVGMLKTKSAAVRLHALNPETKVAAHPERLGKDNAVDLLDGYDIIVDGTDNFPTKYLLNDACVWLKKPLIHAGVARYEGQLTSIVPGQGPCMRCVFEKPPSPDQLFRCHETGIIGVVPGVIGTLQANEVIKYIAGIGELLLGKLLVFNALTASFRQVRIPQNKACPVCGKNPSIHEFIDYEAFCGTGQCRSTR